VLAPLGVFRLGPEPCNSNSNSIVESTSVRSNGFKKHFEFLYWRHNGSSRSGRSKGVVGQRGQQHSTTLAGQHTAGTADVALLRSHAGNEWSSGTITSSIRSSNSAAGGSSSNKQTSCVSCEQLQLNEFVRGSEEGLSDAAASTDLSMHYAGLPVWQRLQQPQEQQQWRSAAQKIHAAWWKDRRLSSCYSRSHRASDKIQHSNLLGAV